MIYITDLPAHRAESADSTTDAQPVPSRLLKKSAIVVHEIREAYLVIRARLARKAGRVGNVIFTSPACRARLACLAHDSRTAGTDFEWVAKDNGFTALRTG